MAVSNGEVLKDDLDSVAKPPPGTVLPPKDIRAILEKTAGYVVRNGSVFEDRIRDKEKSNPKFSFLGASDSYYPFYAWRLSEIKAGRGTNVSAGRVGEAAAASAEPEKPTGPEPPPEFMFSARMPNISAQDLDVVRLTALFVAKNGRQFMTTLSQREARNYQFDFLRPNHSMYQFFSRLVDQYKELLRADSSSDSSNSSRKARIADLELNVKDRFHILARARQRAAYLQYQEEQKVKKEEEAEQEKTNYAQIDWHDFVVVETVLFNEEDDTSDLPPPTSLNDLMSASMEQREMMSLAPSSMRIEEAMPTEEMSAYANNHNGYLPPPPSLQQQQQQPPPQYPMFNPAYPAMPAPNSLPYGFPPQQQQQYPQYPQPPPISYDQAYAQIPPSYQHPSPMEAQRIQQQTDQSEQEAAAIAARSLANQAREQARQSNATAIGPGGMRIKQDYVPKAMANKKAAVRTALCPNCKEQIDLTELESHMRIELLDPRWKAQRQKALDRSSTTNLSTQDVANNLKRLASQRTDVFDPITGRQVDDDRHKKPPAYGGGDNVGVQNPQLGLPLPPPPRMQDQNVDVEAQIRMVQQRYGT